MPEPTVSELLRLDEILNAAMPESRFRRLWAAYAIKFEWPFSTGEEWLWDEDAKTAWQEWADAQGAMSADRQAMRPTL